MRGAVVVPTYGRGELLARCLRSLAQADPAPPVAFVIDGNDEPVVIPAGLPAWIEVIREPNRGPAHARNTGYLAARARGAEVVCFLDDDAIAAPDWFGRHLELHAQHRGAGAIGGGIRNIFSESVIGEYVHRVVFRPLRDDAGPVRMVPSLNVSYKAVCIDEIGLFDTGLKLAGGEDVEHCWRLTENGWEVRYEPDLVVGHHYPTRWKALVRQQRAYGRGFAQSRVRHPALPGSDLLAMPWWRALVGTVPHVGREALDTARALGPAALPVSVVRELTFRSAALAERRRSPQTTANLGSSS
jgi:cellulose synthase/poly-beta-1,6-N-acetylglucosamine synthase-like glycosyltransferase